MDYPETVEWMFRQLPMYQNIGKKAFRTNLSNIQKLVKHLQNPHLEFKTVHVGGTNGKGSVSHMLASVLQESGLKVGLYTSPHLQDFRERIKINRLEIEKNAVVGFMAEHKDFFETGNFSFFEMTVGLAFWYFAQKKVDIAVIEVGLGGRLDSTNIITPELSVITNIGLDHTAFLGTHLATIAGEKAGIIKQNIPVVIGEKNPQTFPVFKEIAAKTDAKLFLAEDYLGKLPGSDLKGTYQQKNIKTALTALEVLNGNGWTISKTAINNGFKKVIKNTGLRGRWDILQEKPKVIADTAHNREGLQYVMQQLSEEQFKTLHIVLGVVADKDLSTILPLFPKNAIYYFCKPAVPRALNAEILKEKALVFHLKGKVYPSVLEAYKTALGSASPEDGIYVGGSTFTVAEVL